MEFIETSFFTKSITDLIEDDIYLELQLCLVLNPHKGNLIPGTGGLRKLRYRTGTKGKRGGIRVIYYTVYEDKIFMLDAYAKSDTEGLTKKQLKRLKDKMRGI